MMKECSELTDNEIEYLQLIMKGYTSSYSIWSYLKQKAEKDPKLTGISYKNVNKRFIKLIKIKAIEEIQIPGTSNIHGRKDFRVSLTGLELLIPYFKKYPKEIQNIVMYMDKIGLDKNLFGLSILEGFTNNTKLLNTYQYNTSVLFNDSHVFKLVSEGKLPKRATGIIKEFHEEMTTFNEYVEEGSKVGREIAEAQDKYEEKYSKVDLELQKEQDKYEEKYIKTEIIDNPTSPNTTSEYLSDIEEKLINDNIEFKINFNDKNKPIFNVRPVLLHASRKKRSEESAHKNMEELYKILDKSDSNNLKLVKELYNQMTSITLLTKRNIKLEKKKLA